MPRLPFNLISSRVYSTISTSVPLASTIYQPSVSSNLAPLIIAHGLFGSKQNWSSLAKALANATGRTTYAIDLRNHGTSPHSHDADYLAMADDVAKFIDDNKLGKVILAGHSMGGKVAMAVALSQGEKIEKLVVIDMAPGTGKISPEFMQYLEGMKEIEAAGVSSRKEADVILQKYESNLGIRQFLLTNLERKVGEDSYKFRLPLEVLEDAISKIGDFPFDSTSNWAGPALFIKGEKSKYINRKNIPLIKEFFPNYQLEVLDAGHWVHAERPKEFMKAVVEFCN